MKTLIEGLAGLFNKQASELAELYDGENLKEQEALEFFRSQLTAKVQDVTRNQTARGKIETGKAFAKTLNDLFTARNLALEGEVDSPDKLEAAIAELENHFKSQQSNKGDKTELTKEAIQAHPLFQELIDPFKQKIQGLETENTGLKTQYAVEKNRDQALKAMFDELERANWVEGEDAVTKQQRRQTMVDLLHLKTNGFQNLRVEDGKVILLDSQGNPVTDNLQNQISFEAFAKSINPFGVHVVDPKKGSSNPSNTSGGQQGQKRTGTLDERLSGILDPAERSRITREYRQEVAPTA
jgi:hypothetical protein